MQGTGSSLAIPWLLVVLLVASPMALLPGVTAHPNVVVPVPGTYVRASSWNGEEPGWTSFHGDSGANGSYPGYFPWTHFRVLWTQSFPNASYSPTNTAPVAPQSSPVVFNGSVYLTNSNLPVVLQVNATDGSLTHAYSLYATTATTATVVSTPLIADVAGSPYLSLSTQKAGTHYTYSLNLSGNVITYCHSGQPAVGGAAALPGGFVQPTQPFGTGNPNGIYIFHSWNLGNNGAVSHCSNVATMTSTDIFNDTPSVGEAYNPSNPSSPYGEYFLTDQTTPTLDAFPMGGGAMLWQDNLGSMAYGSLALVNVSYNDSTAGSRVTAPIGFVANDAAAGSTSNLSAVDVNCASSCFPSTNPTNVLANGTYRLAPLTAGGASGSNSTVALRSLSPFETQVLYAQTDGQLGAVTADLTGTSPLGPNATTGYRVAWRDPWSFPTGAPLIASPATSHGLVVDGNVAGDVYILNASTGAVVWNGTLPGAIFSSPAIYDGNIYVLTSAGVLADIGPAAPTVTVSVANPAHDTAPTPVSVYVNGTSYPTLAPVPVKGAPATVLVSGGGYAAPVRLGSGTTTALGYANFSWTPPYSGTNQTYTFTAFVNASGYASANATTSSIALPPPPLAILSYSALPAAIQLGNSTNLTATVTGGVSPYSYTYVGLPPGCVSQNLPSLPCTPTATGNFTVNVTVTDPTGAYQNASTPLNVTRPTYPQPVIASFLALPSTIWLGNSTNLTANVTGGTAPYTYVYSSLPPGCATADLPVLSCTPTGNGSFPISLLVTDAHGQTANATTNLTVTLAPVTSLKATLSASPSSLVLGNTTTFRSAVSGGTLPYTYAYSSLPPGCATANQSQLNCTPTASGNFLVTVTVTDARGTYVSSNTTLNVSAAGSIPLSATLTASPTAIVLGTSAVITTTALHGTPPYAYVYTGLPKGCSSANTARLNCTPTATGNFTVNVEVTDANQSLARASANLEVTATPLPLSITSFADSPATVTVGNASLFTVVATGGELPYAYTYAGLPSGCVSQDAATLSCRPTTVGNYTIKVTVTDHLGHTATATVALHAVAPGGTSPKTSTSSSGISFEWWILLAGLVGLLLLLLLYRRRKRAPPNEAVRPIAAAPSVTASAEAVAPLTVIAPVPDASEWSESDAEEPHETEAPSLQESPKPEETPPPAAPAGVSPEEYSEDEPGDSAPEPGESTDK